MNILFIVLVSFFSGITASMGLGGGTVLIISLTLIGSYSQLSAQGINLAVFIPVAAVSLFIHTKNKLVEWKKIVPAIICGTISVFAGNAIASRLNSSALSKLFAVFIILIGIKELFSKGKN